MSLASLCCTDDLKERLSTAQDPEAKRRRNLQPPGTPKPPGPGTFLAVLPQCADSSTLETSGFPGTLLLPVFTLPTLHTFSLSYSLASLLLHSAPSRPPSSTLRPVGPPDGNRGPQTLPEPNSSCILLRRQHGKMGRRVEPGARD